MNGTVGHFCSLVLTCTLVSLLQTLARGQVFVHGGEEEQGINYQALLHGQWAGPYDLSESINLPPTNTWAEIAHLAVLPPLNDGLVLIWCRRRGLPGLVDVKPPVEQMTWIWDKRTPNTLVEIPVGNAPDGSEDIFCGGHTFTNDGQVITVGGTDMLSYVNSPATPESSHVIQGTRWGWVFDNAPVALPTSLPGWSRLGSQMTNRRWYPSAFRLSDDRILVPGDHTQPATPETYLTREMLTWGGGTTASWEFRVNYHDPGGCPPVAPSLRYSLDNYPRMHVMLDGSAFRTHDPFSFFDLGRCPGPEPDRFVGDLNPGIPTELEPVHNSVHFVYPDGIGGIDEVIYAIGGGNDIGCDDNTVISDTVLKIYPDVLDSSVDWVPVPALERPRVNAVSLILLDGSILVIGGHRKKPDPGDPLLFTCPTVRRAELYKPPEIFGSGASTGWELMAQVAYSRSYHFVAGLLADGSVVAGGSVGIDASFVSGDPAWYSLEVYSPPYFFQIGRRPTIVSVNAFTDPASIPDLHHGESVQVQSTLFTNAGGQFRVALLSPCTGTHGVEFNQRYVVLELEEEVSFSGNVATIEVNIPQSKGAVPNGWYMLTVVNANGLPSVAWWVRVFDP